MGCGQSKPNPIANTKYVPGKLNPSSPDAIKKNVNGKNSRDELSALEPPKSTSITVDPDKLLTSSNCLGHTGPLSLPPLPPTSPPLAASPSSIQHPLLSEQTEQIILKGNDSNQPQTEQNELSSTLVPLIGFVIKCRTNNESKVFINIFHHPSVVTITNCSGPKSVTDKSGNICMAYDVIVPHAEFIACTHDELLRQQVNEP